MRVTIILDPNFEDRGAQGIAGAFWLIESPGNRILADKLFGSPGSDPNSAIFKSNPTASRLEQALSLLPEVMIHHPDWTELALVGLELNDELHRAFRAEGLSVSQNGAAVIAKPS